MTAQFARAPHTSGRPPAPVYNAPHAALLIDFDNVTMGIRSDLTKELKNLLNSDIIKGKVAVQRAYADWRRYPQYIVPLAENSVDLIFAPAYGSSKKNATDIRLSIDALELVFTRPEIGTFILLSGDSDFSSLVLKLKEYGKYVIGVGIRESASDLLVQNCDEYYSYSALTGLTRAGDEETKQWDPWECVEMAVQQMAEHNDVMRSDRLKQVILELDPNFDEKSLGFTKFNRFLQEAESRGALALHKLENGQFEVGPADAEVVPASAAPPAPATTDTGVTDEVERPRRPRRERGRGRSARAVVETPTPESPGVETTAHFEAEPEEEPYAVLPIEADSEAPVEKMTSRPHSKPVPHAEQAQPGSLKDAFRLLRTAINDVTKGRGAARDSDVKRRILEIDADWSETALGFSKFSRFLRQAHDAEVINLHKLDNGNYEILLPGSRAAAVAEEASDARGKERGRRSGRGRDSARERSDRPAHSPPPAPAPAPAPARAPAPAPAPVHSPSRLRRGGSRSRPGTAAPPPFMPGQMMNAGSKTASVSTVSTVTTPAPAKLEKPKSAAKQPPRARAEKDAASVIKRIVGYKGVGQKTAAAALAAFGAGKLLDVLQNDPDRVRETLGARRAQPLIDGAKTDVEAHSENGAANTAGTTDAAAKKTGARKGGRGQRGGRGRRGGKKSGAPRT